VSVLPCLACGEVSADVRRILVETAEEGRPIVTILVPASHREGAVEIPTEVPERYAVEPRCRDRKACDARVAAITANPLPIETDLAAVTPSDPESDDGVPEPAPGVPTWL
jgi:hypothetical protein